MSPEFTTTDKLTDEALDHGAGGSIRTTRFETVRYWVGHETGDVFGRDCDYDGLTLTIEVADAADAQAMLDAISGDAFRRGVEVGWDERLKQERNNAEVAAHRRASQAAPAPVAWLVEDLHGASSPPIFATISRKHVEGIFSDPGEFKVTPLYAIPAPSDGLREAVDAAWNDAIEALASKLSEMLRATAKANEKNHPQYAAEMEEWADDVQDEARALRRAAPTEGEA